jgi:hypothetical protein
MTYTAKAAVCSDIRTKRNTKRAPCRIFECWTKWYVKKPLGFKRLNAPCLLWHPPRLITMWHAKLNTDSVGPSFHIPFLGPFKAQWSLCIPSAVTLRYWILSTLIYVFVSFLKVFKVYYPKGLQHFKPSGCFQNCEKRLLASSCPSVRPSVWNNSAPTGQIYIKFYIRGFFENLSWNFEFH